MSEAKIHRHFSSLFPVCVSTYQSVYQQEGNGIVTKKQWFTFNFIIIRQEDKLDLNCLWLGCKWDPL